MEIAGILEPLYETAGEYEKLHKIYEVQLGKLTEASDRQAMYQRLAELAEDKLYDPARAFHWWGEALVRGSALGAARSRRASAWPRRPPAGADLVAVYRRVLERHREDAEVRRHTLLRLARVYEFELREADEAVETPPAGPRDRSQGRRRARARSIACTRRRGMYERAGRDPAAAHRGHDRRRRDPRAVLPPRPHLSRRARRSRRGARLLRGRARAGEPQPRAPSRRMRADLLPPRGLAAAVRDLREAGRRRRRRRRDGRHLRAHGAHLRRRRSIATSRRTTRSSCGSACSTSAARSRRRCGALAELYDAPRAVGRAGRDHRAPGAVARGRPRADRASTSASAASGPTSWSASATRSTRGCAPTSSIGATSRRCAPWRTSTLDRRRGTSCPDAAPHHRCRPGARTRSPRRR